MYKSSKRKTVISIALLLLVSGCSLFKVSPNFPQNLSPDARADFLNQLNHWSLTGRIGIITKKESNTANVFWKKNNDQLTLRIYGALGTTYALLTSEPGKAKIVLPDDKTFYGSNAEQLLFQTTGWQIPVYQLHHWILGLTKDATNFELNEQQYPKQISFADWRMTFRSYQSIYGMTMPKKVTIKNPDVTLKFSIYEWELTAPKS